MGGQRGHKSAMETHGRLSKATDSEVYKSWPCIFCGEECTENQEGRPGFDSINCFGCKQWAHQSCAKLTNSQFSNMVRSKNMHWVCTPCADADKVPVTEKDSRLDKLLDIIPVIRSMSSRMTDLEKHVQDISGPKLDEKIEKIVDRKMKEMMEEKSEIEKRKNNLIIVNLSESKKANEKERVESDTRAIKHILAQIVDLDDDEKIDPIRLGNPPKKGEKPRLVKISVKSEDKKQEIIRKARSLNDCKPFEKRVYFNPDFTPKQREDYRRLKEEVKQRTEAGERNLVIRGYKIVQKKPSLQNHTNQRSYKPKIQNVDSSNEDSEDEESSSDENEYDEEDKELVNAAERLDPSSKKGATGGRH